MPFSRAYSEGMEGPASPRSKGRFTDLPRFGRDGHAIMNFINSRDGEGREATPTQRDINTPTHTIFADRLTAVPSFTAEINKSHMGRSCMTSTTGRVEPMTMSCNDPRYLRVEAPYGPIPLGPGSYDVDGALPPLGPLSPDSPMRGSAPAFDPKRANSPFKSPKRGPLFRSAEFAGLGPYLDSSYKGLSDKAPKLYVAPYSRPDVSDYRYATRHSEARKDVPPEFREPADVDAAGRTISFASKVSGRPAAAPFMSRLPRFADKPKELQSPVRRVQQQLVVKVCHTPGSPTAAGQSCPSSPILYASYALVSPKGRPESTGRFERGALSPEHRRPSTVAH